MPVNAVWELMAKKLSGEATSEELAELERLLKADPGLHYAMQTIADLWHQESDCSAEAQQAFDAHAQRMKTLGLDIEQPYHNPFNTLPAPRSTVKRVAIGLSAAVLLLIAFFAWPRSSGASTRNATDAATVSEVSTRYGSRTKLLLPDSTQVWLNSGSKLTYDKSYGAINREVSLSGEAFFDVVKNAQKPFIIHTKSIDIKVLGTAFNVKSFPNEKNTETSLIRGSIEVTFKNRALGKIVLKPNEKLITANEDLDSNELSSTTESQKARYRADARQEPLVLVSHLTYAPADSTVVETSWLDNKLIFRSEAFEDLAVQMERWYGVHIRFADESIKPRKLNGIFEKESVEEALEALQLITPFNYTIAKSEIVISLK